jgi:hypothetical protein
MTQKQARILAIALVVHLIVLRFTWRDLNRRPNSAVRGNKRLWRLASGLNTSGSVAYWLLGRKSVPRHGAIETVEVVQVVPA